MLQKTLPYIARRDPHNCIVARVICGGAPKKLHPDDPFFKCLEMSGNGLVDYILKKLTAALAASEGRPFDDFLYMLLNECNVFLGTRNLCQLYGAGIILMSL
ncbi:MAG TPA: hypothetical protein VHB45_01165 [Alloacidobacterium sp.]|nr:hypothetical protein [Alloacidobacterium sp.]